MTKTTTRVRKVPIKTLKTHSNFAEEIYQLEKADKFLDRITTVLSVVAVVLLVTLIIINIK